VNKEDYVNIKTVSGSLIIFCCIILSRSQQKNDTGTNSLSL